SVTLRPVTVIHTYNFPPQHLTSPQLYQHRRLRPSKSQTRIRNLRSPDPYHPKEKPLDPPRNNKKPILKTEVIAWR
ncbi:MAG: hypothetical protein Q9173_006853, partial [Seirophora scorigena]